MDKTIQGTSSGSAGKIRVLLVDDSLLVLELLTRMISTSPDIEIAGTARNGKEAIPKIELLNPDVVCTDLEMPLMDGLELTSYIMQNTPRPVLVVSSVVDQTRDSANVFALLKAGAVDVHQKPNLMNNEDFQKAARELNSKIKVVAGVYIFKRKPASDRVATAPLNIQQRKGRFRAVAIGVSTGGPQLLAEILPGLPKDFSMPVFVVQHISDGFIQGLVNWLDKNCALEVKIAENWESPKPGVIYFPEEQTHLTIERGGRIFLSKDPPLDGHRPAVDFLFSSAAEFYRDSVIGIILTGMGKDGVKGLHRIKLRGGVTIAQSEESCVVYGMPGEAVKTGAAVKVLSPSEIIRELIIFDQLNKNHHG
ncbi:MAG: chemotaxis-specific protein-glutamate methyltransferase CheB [Ignavibacteriaceae bacterium]|nr:chemotaxis-specific protein-glutamate methyltransferase CheB [Ignavibacteriaceae bacterium]